MTTPLRLITIPVSHFCEKARWALDLAGIPFAEEAHVPILHRIHVKRAGGCSSTPLLISPDGPLTESSDIVRWCNRPRGERPALAAESDDAWAWVARLDREFGPDVRRTAYDALLPHSALAREFLGRTTPAWENRLLRLAFPLLRVAMRKGLAINPPRVARSEARIEQLLSEVDALLADGRTTLLGGPFSVADLTFAALGAPLVFPAEYGGPMPAIARLPDAFRARVLERRGRPSGQLILRHYRDHRRRSFP
ncbi:MAG: glutathione S-transferase [Myxococcales bacterium]|nr:glutathione S-transferase [Myxococcales bacterium]